MDDKGSSRKYLGGAKTGSKARKRRDEARAGFFFVVMEKAAFEYDINAWCGWEDIRFIPFLSEIPPSLEVSLDVVGTEALLRDVGAT